MEAFLLGFLLYRLTYTTASLSNMWWKIETSTASWYQPNTTETFIGYFSFISHMKGKHFVI